MQPQSGHSPPGAALQSSHQSGGVCRYPGIFFSLIVKVYQISAVIQGAK